MRLRLFLQTKKKASISGFLLGIVVVLCAYVVVEISLANKDTQEILNDWGSSIVRIECFDTWGAWSGSGTLWRVDRQFVVTTNKHAVDTENCEIFVTSFEDGISEVYSYVYPIKPGSLKEFPDNQDFMSFVLDEYAEGDSLSNLLPLAHRVTGRCTKKLYAPGSNIFLLGYPGVGTSGGKALTINEGIISGIERGFSFSQEAPPTWYVTSAKIDSGISGGAAIASDGCFIGIPTWAYIGDMESQGRLFILGGESSYILDTLRP